MSGGETANIAQMADLLADRIFSVFGWERSGPANENFGCTSSVEHDREKHPCDVVFHYDHPYSDARVYVLFDLKSFAADSIKAGQISVAVDGLAMSVECAARSEEWQERHVNRTMSSDVHGCLFIYNHDGQYTNSFLPLLKTALKDCKHTLPPGRRVFVLDPARISVLHTVANDIRQLRGDEKLPPAEYCYFHHPELVRLRRREGRLGQASIETLMSPWQVVAYERSEAAKPLQRGHVMYYAHRGTSADEFLYIIDYFFRASMLETHDPVRLRMVNPGPQAATLYERAKEEYAERHAPSAGFRKFIRERLAHVSFEVVDAVVPQFSKDAIGMTRRGTP